MSKHFIFGQATHAGVAHAEKNEDSVWSFYSTGRSIENYPDFGLFIIADGLGGQLDGEKASALTVRTIVAHIMETTYMPSIRGDETLSPFEGLNEAINKAHLEVSRETDEGGATVVTAIIVGDMAYIAHVGDSRAYLVTGDEVEQLTTDHSLVRRLYDLGQLTTRELDTHPMENVIYRALGQEEQIEIDVMKRRLPAGSYLVLCTDGLWRQVTQEEIAETIHSHVDLRAACDRFIELANQRGGPDNISVIVIQTP